MKTILDTRYDGPGFDNLPLPHCAGVGLKAEHVDDILESPQTAGFFEVHAENYMGAGGLPHHQLTMIRQQYPISLHGVGMSIGGENPLDPNHLKRFKALVERYNPGMVSEHLAWSTHDDVFYNDLLPLPYTARTLARVVEHVSQVQNTIGRQILIENPSTYVIFAESTLSELDFMAELATRSGCGLLLDVNNVYISAANHHYSPTHYIDNFPLELVQEIHLAGHATDRDGNNNTLLIDAHDREVCDDVWSLFERVIAKTGALPSLIEWDNEIPSWPVLAAEAEKANEILNRFPASNFLHPGGMTGVRANSILAASSINHAPDRS